MARYTKQTWSNSPSTATPITAARLTHIEDGIDGVSEVVEDGRLSEESIDALAPLASPTFTGTVAGVTKAHVGLGNADNTSDANKPVSTAQATADALRIPLTQKAAASGVASLDGSTKVPIAQIPLDTIAASAELSATFVAFKQAAKNPDLLIVGAVTVDGSDLVTSAVVVWPDGKPGVLTITSRQAVTNAVLAYTITHVDGATTTTYTQPAITRNANGAATNVPQIVVS